MLLKYKSPILTTADVIVYTFGSSFSRGPITIIFSTSAIPKDGKYVLSFYSEVAYVIERFFYDVNIIDKEDVDDFQNKNNNKLEPEKELVPIKNQESERFTESTNTVNAIFKICPSCSEKGLKTENGCDTCMDCGYSKCDK